MEYRYRRIHIPTGEYSELTLSHLVAKDVDNLNDWYQLLCRWNSQQPTVWAYAPIKE